MASSFMGLYVQREGLILAQKALDITGNNISNINTPGYSRQRVDICSVANSRSTLLYNTAVSMSGRGSEAVGVAQIRDRLLDTKVRNYSGDLCDVGIKVDVMSNVEDIFDSIEADDLGASFASIISDFKAALQGFSADNADRTEMANIAKNAADSLVHNVTNYDAKLTDVSNQTLGDTKVTVQRINEILAEMGKLNEDIKISYISMGYINSNASNYEVMHDYGPLELKDQMNSLLDELSQYGNTSVTEESDGTFTVDFAERCVVKDKYYSQIAITKEDPKPTELEYVVSKERMDKDQWYELNINHGTGGDTELVVRKYADEVGGTISLSDRNTDGNYKLDKGSLRGYLDVYNGRGIYAEGVSGSLDRVNDALEKLSKYNKGLAGTPVSDAPTAKEAAELAEYIEKTIGATIPKDASENYTEPYTVQFNGNTLLNAAGDTGSILPGKENNITFVDENGDPIAALRADVGGPKGAENFNDALANLAKINKEIAALNAKMDAPAAANTADVGKINDYLTQLQQHNNGTAPLTDAEITTIFSELSGLVKDFKSEKDPTSGKVSIKSGSKVLLETDGTLVPATEENLANPSQLTRPEMIAYMTERTEKEKEAGRFVGLLTDGGVKIKQDDTTKLFSATLKDSVTGNDIPLLDGADYGTPRKMKAEETIDIVDASGNPSTRPADDLGGAAKEYLAEERKVIANSYRGIEYYRDMLNAFVKTITEEFNGVFDKFGYEIFTYDDDKDATTPPDFRSAARNFRVGKDWTQNPEIIANPTGSNKYEELDNVYINKLLGVLSSNQKYGDGTIYHELEYPVEQFVSQICNEVGKQVGTEKSVYKATDIMLTAEETLRSEAMDVQMDEEGINMMNYQKWYNAIARMISTMDEALDKLINGTGRVGL